MNHVRLNNKKSRSIFYLIEKIIHGQTNKTYILVLGTVPQLFRFEASSFFRFSSFLKPIENKLKLHIVLKTFGNTFTRFPVTPIMFRDLNLKQFFLMGIRIWTHGERQKTDDKKIIS